jgi:hypothetical protein
MVGRVAEAGRASEEGVWPDSSIEKRHELPDDITRKDRHGYVSVTPRPATRGDSADRYSRQQQQRADSQGAHEHEKQKNVG